MVWQIGLAVIPAGLILAGCANDPQETGQRRTSADSLKYKVETEFAKGFTIEHLPGFKRLTVRNPWQGARDIRYEYYLVPREGSLQGIPRGARVIRTPVEKIICMSTTHIGMLDYTGKLNTLAGISGARFVNNKTVRERIRTGEIIDVGYDQNINYEVIIRMQPDLVMTYGVGSEISGYINKLQELGIPVVLNGDYLEQTPLAKAEWVKFLASFYNTEEYVNNKFSLMVLEYNRVKGLCTDTKTRPDVMIGLPWKDTWYIPGANSFAAHFIRDAGGNYIWSDRNTHEALPFSIEAVFGQAQNADIWINPGAASSLGEILLTDERLSGFSPVIYGQVYNNNRKLNDLGGNDYWESGVVNPHLVLKDLVHIFHPGLLSDHQLVYYRKLQ